MNISAKKTTQWLKPSFDSIPDTLKKHPHWAVWKSTPRKNGKRGKPPLNPRTGEYAKVNDPGSFVTFDEARKAYESGEYDGIGILITSNDSLCGVDLDDCFSSPERRAIYKDFVSTTKTYTEKSPSSMGIRMICKVAPELVLDRAKRDGVEIYTGKSGNRFLTITGHIIDNRCKTLKSNNKISKLHNKYLTNSRNHSESGTRKKRTAHDTSQSGEDYRFCLKHAREGKSAEEIDALFRKSKLFRPKWDEPRGDTTYGQMTIAKAILAASKDQSFKTEIELLNVKEMISSDPPEMEWVLRDIVPSGMIGEMIGDSGLGKSSLLFQMAIAAASGKNIPPFFPDSPRKILLLNVEDPTDQLHRKIRHQVQSAELRRLELDLLANNLVMPKGFGSIGPLMKRQDGNPVPTLIGKKVRSLIARKKPDLVILDTKSRLYGLDENNNDDAATWLRFLERITAKIGCSFIVAHHTGKGEGKISGRGASAFSNNTRFNLTLRPISGAEANKNGISEEETGNYFRVDVSSSYTSRQQPMYLAPRHFVWI
jgi:hypothetical protein